MPTDLGPNDGRVETIKELLQELPPEQLEDVMAAARAAVEPQAELEEKAIDILAPAEDTDDDEDLGDEKPSATDWQQQDHAAPNVPQPSAEDIAAVTEMFKRGGTNEQFETLKAEVLARRATPAEEQQARDRQGWRLVIGPLYRVLVAEGVRLGQSQRGAAPPPAAGSRPARAAKPRTPAPARSNSSASGSARQAPAPEEPKLPPMLLPTGELNPDFERIAACGRLYGREKLTN